MSSTSSTIPVGFAPGLALHTEVGADDSESGRRIEDWIVSNLDDRPAKAGEADWHDTIGQLAPTGRRTLRREAPPGPGGWTRCRLAQKRGITLVAIIDESLVKEHDLAELAGDLVALVEAGHRRLVVDFANVERLSIRAVVALAETVRGEAGRGGTLKFCGFRPELAPIVAMVGLASRVEVCPDASSAIAGPWPESPGLRPLPVPVLAALLRSDRHEVPPPPPADKESPPMPDVRLIAHAGPFEGRAVAVGVRRFVIGRASGCQLRLGFPTVSRHHAAIERRGGAVVLLDLGSTNGTIHNGDPLRDESARLSDGDLVRIGPLTFTLAIGAVPDRAQEADDSIVEAALAGPPEGANPEDTVFATEDFAFHADLSDDGLLQVEVVEGVVVVAPRRADLDAEPTIDGLRDALASLLDRHPSRRVVVDLVHVGHVSGRAIGVLLAHHLRLDRDGGALRVCRANPRVAALLEGVRLGMLVECHPTVDDAVLAAWPRPVTDARA